MLTQEKILDGKSYAEFKAALIASNCQRCELSRARTQIVVDRGNPDAKVLFIGEAPGENEDLEGKAFVGRSGRLLDQLLLSLGFDTNKDSLIINIAKCRPPDNRRPTSNEAEACSGYLHKQIELVKPRVILLLGATALKYIVPDKKKFSMREEAGRFFEHSSYPGVKLMVLYHPAYILRDPRKKPEMIEHLQVFKAYWDKSK